MAISVINVDGSTYPINDNRITFTSGATTNFLRQDGSWSEVSVSDTKVNQTATKVSGGYPIVFSVTSATTGAWTDGSKETHVDPAIAVNPAKSLINIRAQANNSTNTWYSTSYGTGSGYYIYDNDNGKYLGAFNAAIQGTTSTTSGETRLYIGNSTTVGQAGNARGRILLYGTSSGNAQVITEVGSSDRVYTIPNVADSEFVMTAGVQTITGNKTFDGAVYFGGTTSYYVSTAGNSRFHNIIADGKVTLNSTLVGKSGDISTGNYTTTVPTSAGQTGQMIFVLQ